MYAAKDPAAVACACSRTRSAPAHRRASTSSADLHAAIAADQFASTTSRSSTSLMAGSSASRRSCAGSIRRAGCSARTRSSPLRRSPASSLASADRAGHRAARRRAWNRATDGPRSASREPVRGQLLDSHLVADVAAALERPASPAKQLTLELTESRAAGRPGRAHTLHDLDALGVRIAHRRLRHRLLVALLPRPLPVDTLKIDRSFVSPGHAAPPDATLIGAVLYIADALGLSVVAEGVETLAQQSALVALGCTQGQGYRFSKPVTSGQVVGLIQTASLAALQHARAAA